MLQKSFAPAPNHHRSLLRALLFALLFAHIHVTLHDLDLTANDTDPHKSCHICRLAFAPAALLAQATLLLASPCVFFFGTYIPPLVTTCAQSLIFQSRAPPFA